MHRSSHTRWGLGRDYSNLVLPLQSAMQRGWSENLLAQVGRTSPLRQACRLFSIIHDDKCYFASPQGTKDIVSVLLLSTFLSHTRVNSMHILDSGRSIDLWNYKFISIIQRYCAGGVNLESQRDTWRAEDNQTAWMRCSGLQPLLIRLDLLDLS